MKLTYHPAVRREVELISDWYEAQRLSLGREFLFDLKETIEELLINPQRWATEYSVTRIGILKVFPYNVHYRDYPNRVRILGVIHQSRDDSEVRNRR